MTDQGFGMVVRPLPGNGLVAHLGGLLLVCDSGDAAAAELVQALRETAATGGDGRALARRAAQILARSMTGDPATCAVAGPSGNGGVALLVSGQATAAVRSGDGEQRLTGSDALTWTDRLVKGPVQHVELSLPDAGQADPLLQLDGGVVRAGGVVLELSEHADQRPGTPAPSRPEVRPLTTEMPATGYHNVEEELRKPRQEPPAPERPSVPLAPYPMQSGPQPRHEMPAPPDPGQHRPQPPSGPVPPPQGPPSGPIPPQAPPPGPPSGPLRAVPPFAEQQPFEQPGPPPFEQQGPPPFEHQGPPPFEQQGPPQPHFEHGPPPFEPGAPFDHHPPGNGAGPEGEQHHGAHSGPQEQHADGQNLVYGVDCKNDHFNDPRLPYCASCGVALVQRTLVPYKGPRPPLGMLILDDGTALPLESDYLLGRDPDRAPEVTGGTARPAKVTSPDGSVSRRHLRVALDGWDVNLVDLGSVNGTQIQPPGDPNFYDIPPNEPVTITPGTTVRIGVSRTMRFEARRS